MENIIPFSKLPIDSFYFLEIYIANLRDSMWI